MGLPAAAAASSHPLPPPLFFFFWLAWSRFIKFTATLAGAALRRPKVATATPQQQRLMAAIGLLDASAYTVYCLGGLGAASACMLCRMLPGQPYAAPAQRTWLPPQATHAARHHVVVQASSGWGPRWPTCCCREWGRS